MPEGNQIAKESVLANINTSGIRTSANGTGTSNMLSVTFGSVSAGATTSMPSSSGNCILSHVTGTGVYNITFSSTMSREKIGNLPVTVSLSGPDPGFITWTGNFMDRAKLVIRTFNSSGAPADRGFAFAIYKP